MPSQSPTPAKWEKIRADYINGLGTIADLADRHGVRVDTAQKRSRKESWVSLRTKREESALAALIPPVPPQTLPAAEPAKPIEIDPVWLNAQAKAYFAEFAALFEQARKMAAELSGPGQQLTVLQFSKFASALGVLASANAKFLGLDKKGKPSKQQRMEIEPIES